MDNVLVAFIDFLGFSSYVEKNPDSMTLKCQLERALESGYKHLEKIQESAPEGTDERLVILYPQISRSIKMFMLSDSLIVWLNINEITIWYSEANPPKVDDGNLESFIERHSYFFFLRTISMMTCNLIFSTNLLVRGGIALGDFHISKLKQVEGDFLFSKALIDAFEIEKRARMPRIILSPELCDKIKCLVPYVSESMLAIDSDGEWILDFYQYLRIWSGNSQMIEHILRGAIDDSGKDTFDVVIRKQLNLLRNKERAHWNKWHWFKEYHNKKMREIDVKFVIEGQYGNFTKR